MRFGRRGRGEQDGRDLRSADLLPDPVEPVLAGPDAALEFLVGRVADGHRVPEQRLDGVADRVRDRLVGVGVAYGDALRGAVGHR